MRGLVLKYDGIVYQHAGELLLDWPETRDIRCQCVHTYWTSLNNFAFGQIFGSSLLTPVINRGGVLTSMPPLVEGGETPGEILLGTHFSRKRKVKLLSSPHWPEATLIKDPNDGGRLKDALSRLGGLVNTHRSVWGEYALREIYLSFHPKGGQWHKVDGFWQFEGRTHSYPDSDKESAVPSAYVDSIRRFVEDRLPKTLEKRRAPAGALEGYIRRNVVLHLAIHPVSNLTSDPDFEDPASSARVLHTTRGTVAGGEVEQHLWRAQELTVPGLLRTMIEYAAKEQQPDRRRRTLIEKIQEASESPDLDAIREGLVEAVSHAHNKEMDQLRRLMRHLETLSVKAGAAPEGGLIYLGETEYRNAISVLREMGAGREGATFSDAFYRVFPELIRPQSNTDGIL